MKRSLDKKNNSFYILFSDHCGSPLGMESGAIKDADISASSAYDSGSVGSQHSR